MKSLTRAVAAASSVLLGVGLLSAPLAAAAEEPAPAPIETLGEFPASDFVAQAAELAPGLAEALARDVSLTPEEYLAESAAATQAVEVVASLQGVGIGVLGSRMEGTELVVNVTTADEAAVVESTGAIAEFGEPEATWSDEGLDIQPAADVYNGQGWVWSDGTYIYQCSVGFTGYLVSSGAPQFATAGHCTDDMTGSARLYNQTAPGQSGTPGATLGAKVAGTITFGGGVDVGRIAVGSNVQKPSVLTWNGGRGAPLAGAPISLTGDAAPIVGATLCKSGSRTGWSCGPIAQVDYSANVGSPATVVRSVVAKLCVLPGDSGGVGIVGSKGVGITSWTTADITQTGNNCADSTAVYGGFFQMVSPGGFQSVQSTYTTTWEMAASVSAPAITSYSGPSTSRTAINGTVNNPGRNYKVDVYLDGSSSVFATANVNASTGAWTVNTSSVPAGFHTFTAVARYGTWSKSSATAGTFARGITVERIQGANRYETSSSIASRFSNPSTVYIASGENYPDALSAAPAAGMNGSPLLLTSPTSLPTTISSRLTAIDPDRVVILGSTAAISAGVKNQIAALLPSATIVREQGADRWSTSREVSRLEFPAGATTTAYLASGMDFPDALSAAAAAGDASAPVILVYGPSSTLDPEVRQLLVNLGVTNVVITGSTVAISQGIQNGVDAIPGVSVTRLAGADRWATSVAINAAAFPQATEVFLASGLGFADALSGAPLAGSKGAPLFVVPPSCIPQGTLQAIAEMGATKVTILGSTAALGNEVAALTPC